MTSKNIKAQVERSSLGTRSAKAARRTVSDDVSRRIVANAASGRYATKSPKKSGG
ncbi:hypothetical protein GCM10009719_10510 [Nocardioides kribbensis]